MEKTFRYSPKNVCSREMIITYEGDKIVKVQTIGGCPGNTQGVNKLVVGKTFDEVIAELQGIKCPGSATRMTSCPDQLANALLALKAQEAK
jgi:uncharacterized protein (TIGR03905 family)